MLDTVLVILIVSLAAAFVGRRAWRSLRAAKAATNGCDSHCGCDAPSTTAQSTTATTRRR